MAKKELLLISNKTEMLSAIQDLLALRTLQALVKTTATTVEDSVKARRVRFNLPIGAATDFDGPNGGITFVEQVKRDFNPAAIKKYMGEEVYSMVTEVKVKTGTTREWLRTQIAERLGDGRLTKKQAAEILEEGDSTIKVKNDFSRRAAGQQPLLIWHGTGQPDDHYVCQMPTIVDRLQNPEEIDTSDEDEESEG